MFKDFNLKTIFPEILLTLNFWMIEIVSCSPVDLQLQAHGWTSDSAISKTTDGEDLWAYSLSQGRPVILSRNWK